MVGNLTVSLPHFWSSGEFSFDLFVGEDGDYSDSFLMVLCLANNKQCNVMEVLGSL